LKAGGNQSNRFAEISDYIANRMEMEDSKSVPVGSSHGRMNRQYPLILTHTTYIIRNLGKPTALLVTFHAGFMIDLYLDPEDGGDMFLRNVG
jgi:hypothetical protein